MAETKTGKLEDRKRKLLTELSGCQLIIRGTAFERYSVCSRPSCKCHKGEKHGPRYYVAVTSDRRQRQHYVPVSQAGAVSEGVDHFHRAMSIITEITEINLQLMKARALNK